MSRELPAHVLPTLGRSTHQVPCPSVMALRSSGQYTEEKIARWAAAAGWLQRMSVATILLCCALFLFWSRRWPVIGDASLVHYICFLMDHGMAPYRDLGDMNLPGVFLTEWTVMHLFGFGDVAWRCFDALLLLAAAVSMRVLTRAGGWFATVFAAGIFTLVHGRDGLQQAGQRDLTEAVVLLGAAACLAVGLQALMGFHGRAAAICFGLLCGWALALKPTAIPFVLAWTALGWWMLRQQQRSPAAFLLPSAAAMLVFPAACLVFLWRHGATGAFLHGLRSVVPYYASLGHKPLGFLLLHSVAPLLPVVIPWLLLLCVRRPDMDVCRMILLAGMALGIFAYVAQARGYPYYRYPLLAFLLPLMSIDFAFALRAVRSAWPARALATAATLLGALLIPITSVWQIHRFDAGDLGFIDSLEDRLTRLGGPALSGHVQCIDSISGCGTTLYRMRLVQSTGVLSDFLLFGPEEKPVVQETRASLAASLKNDPPWVMVVSGRLHIDGPGNFRKVERWPALQAMLDTRYCLSKQWQPSHPVHWWGRSELPDSYRIYLLRAHFSDCAGPALSAGR